MIIASAQFLLIFFINYTNPKPNLILRSLFSFYAGYKLSKILSSFPILYLSGGSCVAAIIIGGSTAKSFFQIICGATCTAKPLTMVEWYLVFTCIAVVFAQLPNLNSIAGVSLIGAITAVGYCTIIWVVSVAKGRLPMVSYNPVRHGSQTEQVFDILNALGMIAFAFRGHNLILEIQVYIYISKIIHLVFILFLIQVPS